MGSDTRHSDPSLRCPEDVASCALAGLSDGNISFPRGCWQGGLLRRKVHCELPQRANGLLDLSKSNDIILK